MKFIVLGKKHLIALGLLLLIGVFVLLAAAQGFSQSMAANGTKAPNGTVSTVHQTASSQPMSSSSAPLELPGINPTDPS